MNKAKMFSLTAGLVLAITFTLSCSSDDDGGGSSSGDKGNNIKNYKTVVIGTQTWMAENLNYAVAGSKCFGEGGEVIIDQDEDGNFITKTLSNAEVQANCEKYGRLYDWSTAMALDPSCNSNSCSSQIQQPHQGICPSGWHIPNNDDWEILMDYVGGSGTAGTKLKARSGWNENGNGTDDYGFSALPGGNGLPGGSFWGVGNYGTWCSASEYNDGLAYSRFMFDNSDEFTNLDEGDKPYLESVRCLKD